MNRRRDAGRRAQHAFGAAVAVDICVVPVIDAGIETSLDSGGDFIFVDIGPAIGSAVDPIQSAHGPAAEADFRDGDVGVAEFAEIHIAILQLG